MDSSLLNLISQPRGNPKRIILGCTGSVATIKVPQIVRALEEKGHAVILVPTKCAFHFLYTQSQDLKRLNSDDSFVENKQISNKVEIVCNHNLDLKCNACTICETRKFYSDFKIIEDNDEWSSWQKRGDPVLHIKLRDWADLLLIAPLDANTLAKIAQGFCDNLLTCIVRAWDVKRPLVFCPAMNTHMYSHPFTDEHRKKLKVRNTYLLI